MTTDEVAVLHISDLHCVADPRERVYGELSDDNLDAVLTMAVADGRGPDVVIVTGDVADDAAPATYERVADRLRRGPSTVFWVPGNHDRAELMAALAPGAYPSHVFVAHWQLVFLDSAWPGHDAGRLGREQTAWLDARLLEVDRPTVVVLHHPPLPSCEDVACQLSDADEFLDVVGRHPQVCAVLTGHNHRPFEHRRGPTLFLGAPSTCRQAHHAPPRHAWTDEGPAARSLRLAPDGRIRQRLEWLHEPPVEPELSWWT